MASGGKLTSGSNCADEITWAASIFRPAILNRPLKVVSFDSKKAADMLGVHYFSVYRLIQRGKLKTCRALRGKLLVPRAELLKLLETE
jgi:excisionase family DNA binding protein